MWFVLTAGEAHAVDPAFSVTVSPETATWPETRTLTYRVQITTGAEEERFRLTAQGFPAFLGFDGQSEGALLSPDAGELDGPGTLGPTAMPAVATCRTSLRARHGVPGYSVDYDVAVPASTSTTLVIPALVAADPPWPGEQYRLGLTAKNAFAGMGGGAPTLDADTAIPVPAVAAAGRTGVRLSIAANIATVPGCGGTPPRNAGVPITVTGRADPSLAGEQVRIVVARWESAPSTLAMVPVTADGSFAAPVWRPRAFGLWEIGAQYTSTRPDLADDFAAVRLFELTAAVPQVEPRVAPVARVGRTARVRRGAARVRMSCPAGTQPCRGVVRLTLRTKLAGAKRFAVAAGRRATVSVPLRPAARRALKKATRLRMRAEIRVGQTRSRSTIVVRAG